MHVSGEENKELLPCMCKERESKKAKQKGKETLPLLKWAEGGKWVKEICWLIL